MTGSRIDINNHENAARKRVGLPECKELRFYPNPCDASSKVKIISWDIAEEREDYTVLFVETERKTYTIHAGIVAYMQSDDFEERNCTKYLDSEDCNAD